MKYKPNDINLLAEMINNGVLTEFVDNIRYSVTFNEYGHYTQDDIADKIKWCDAMEHSIKKDNLKNKDRRGIVLEYLMIEARLYQDIIDDRDKPDLGYCDFAEL